MESFSFDKRTLNRIIQILEEFNRHDLIPTVKSIFERPNAGIFPATGTTGDYVSSNRILASLDVYDGDFWFNTGKNLYTKIRIMGGNESIDEIDLEMFTANWRETYIMKPLINTRYNKLRGRC